MVTLQEYINEALVEEARKPEDVLMDNYKKQEHIDDILYAYDIAKENDWKDMPKEKYADYMRERDGISSSGAKSYMNLIKSMVVMGKEKVNKFIEDNWKSDLDNYGFEFDK